MSKQFHFKQFSLASVQSLNVSLQFNFQKYLFKVIQFSQTVLIQTIQFSISIVFVNTQLNVKNSSISSNLV